MTKENDSSSFYTYILLWMKANQCNLDAFSTPLLLCLFYIKFLKFSVEYDVIKINIKECEKQYIKKKLFQKIFRKIWFEI